MHSSEAVADRHRLIGISLQITCKGEAGVNISRKPSLILHPKSRSYPSLEYLAHFGKLLDQEGRSAAGRTECLRVRRYINIVISLLLGFCADKDSLITALSSAQLDKTWLWKIGSLRHSNNRRVLRASNCVRGEVRWNNNTKRGTTRILALRFTGSAEIRIQEHMT